MTTEQHPTPQLTIDVSTLHDLVAALDHELPPSFALGAEETDKTVNVTISNADDSWHCLLVWTKCCGGLFRHEAIGLGGAFSKPEAIVEPADPSISSLIRACRVRPVMLH